MATVDERTAETLRMEFAGRLQEERRSLLRTVVATDDELATLEQHQAGAPVEDAGTDAIGILLGRLEGQEKHELDEIADAIERLNRGVYGRCEGCGREIALARLRAMPAARRCVECQKQHEVP
jgi:RNA polymerase-binding protein DksA